MIVAKILLAIMLGHLINSCSTVSWEKTSLEHSYKDIKRVVTNHPQKVDLFFRKGPIAVEKISDFKIPLSHDEEIEVDLFLPQQSKRAPLLIFQHGNKSSKDYHSYQALLASTWGFNAITVEQPNQGQWLSNGSRLKRLVDLLALWPQLLKQKYTPNKIILVGHSFGGSAIAIATGKGAPVHGLIFLDPALVHKSVLSHLRKIKIPAILIGADESVFKSRKRKQFFRMIGGPITEFSIKGATHNDAQFPNMFSWRQTLGLSPNPKEERQRQFAAAIVASAFHLAEQPLDKKILDSFNKSARLALSKIRQKN